MPDQTQLLTSLLALTHDVRTLAVALMAGGASAVVGALVCWLVVGRPWAVGAMWPLSLGGLVLLASGIAGFVESATQGVVLPDVVREAPHRLEDLRSADVEAVERLRALELVDVALVGVGAAMCLRRGQSRGAGVALMLLSVGALIVDGQSREQHETRRALIEAARP